MNIGSSNRNKYDICNYDQSLYESTGPGQYALYVGKFENKSKCVGDKFYFRQDPALVSVESELLNISRPLSDCSMFKYSPACRRSGMCISTFDSRVPVVPAPEVCPIVYNNIPRQRGPGYANLRAMSRDICQQ